jgi:hypothetical protein
MASSRESTLMRRASFAVSSGPQKVNRADIKRNFGFRRAAWQGQLQGLQELPLPGAGIGRAASDNFSALRMNQFYAAEFF